MKKIVSCAALVVMSCGFALGQVERVLYSFGSNPNDGTTPLYSTSPILDAKGNIFGVTLYGGTFDGGTVFEVSPNSDGTWSETILYDFCTEAGGGTCPNGGLPGGGLVEDAKGNLYGVAAEGGAPCALLGNLGCGVVYKLSPPSLPGGAWTETVIHSFCQVNRCADGGGPAGKLILDKAGNLYGTTAEAGTDNVGTVFELSPASGGLWTESILYAFCSSGGECVDGAAPQEGVIFDKSGNLYGTTFQGGDTGFGVVFKLSPGSSWTETVLYTFPAQSDTQFKYTYSGPVTLDPLGNIYGSATWVKNPEGEYYPGEVYRLRTNGDVSVFSFKGREGSGPLDGVIVDAKHAVIYGTTSQSGNNFGNVFQIAANGRETVLYKFCQLDSCTDGRFPSGIAEDGSGNLYGATREGGTHDAGAVFEITP